MITDERAGCVDLDPAMFRPTTATGRRKALAVCRHCPLAEACLEAALADPTGAYGRIAGGTTTEERAHIAAVRDRARVRVSKPKVASAYRDLWDGHVGESADPARRQAARHMAQDQAAVKALGERRFVAESVRCFGSALRSAVADGDRTGVEHLMRGLPEEHRAALLVAFAGELGGA
ncbi:WhiB family transcriptional regulator [Nocardiopsis tropica]|uniref:WhiB family transcriptional regulator n=1 Tax=Nocardiopsis tropica TaxID=109330 RepID=A0ABU7KQZ6_9ACTN|nr:WhiB family transcriptional regulator [Nocardiopsis umidischolae]MEE2051725.1 WhiB family transcriptional regulator [Nocardiopsis umidischolae]